MKLLLALLALAPAAPAADQAAAALAGSTWQVTTFAGRAPLADHPVTFGFDDGGNIAGDTSCNRFAADCKAEGSNMRVGPLRSTRRACEPEIMRQEREFLLLLESVTSWEIDADGTLILRGGDGEIRARPHPEPPGS